MDSSESTKIVYDRIQKLEPDLASKIVGFLLFHDNENHQMIRLAFSPDNVILSITNRVKTELGFISSNPQNPQMQQSSLVEFPSKICQHYSKGFCKHGPNCRFIHGNLNEGVIWDQLFSSGSLKMLEMELTSLLISRNGAPISISLLPVLYHYMFGKALICKAGFTLVELLARMTNTIRLLEIAHGQHVLILAEDLPKYIEYKNERIEHGGSAARQIYLTFPAESTFTEQEVRYHFNGFGPVEDVRMPFQQKRMFGFVTFVFPETVRMILARGNPHFIYGARVLVKPYKEKTQPDHKKNPNKKDPTNLGLQSFDGDSKSQAVSRTPNGNKRRVRKNVVQEHEVELETERRRLSEFQLVPNRMSNGYGKKADLKDSVSEMDPPAKKELDA